MMNNIGLRSFCPTRSSTSLTDSNVEKCHENPNRNPKWLLSDALNFQILEPSYRKPTTICTQDWHCGFQDPTPPPHPPILHISCSLKSIMTPYCARWNYLWPPLSEWMHLREADGGGNGPLILIWARLLEAVLPCSYLIIFFGLHWRLVASVQYPYSAVMGEILNEMNTVST